MMAPPANAGLPVLAHTSVGITFDSTTFTVCAIGYVDDGTGIAGQWQFEITGFRSDGTLIDTLALVPGEAFPSSCYTVAKNGTANGAFAVTLTFETVGENSPNTIPDVVGLAGGIGDWNPSGAESFGT